jgi:MazG family protein
MSKATFEDLVKVMDRLREPGGCPWDREQDWSSLRQYVIEEAYEVVEAIDHGDPAHVAEECGDLLFQVVFLSRIAREEGWFDVYDTITSIRDKLVHRHPHVFSDVIAETPEEVLKNWEALKAQERAEKGQTGALDGVASALPGLVRAMKLGQKASRVGFDWPDTAGVVAKVDEEIGELKEALAADQADEIRHELGDALFALAQLGRVLGVNPEDALREASGRFETRFRKVESGVREEGLEMDQMDIEELERRWQAAKRS